jgi:hypothetical protein
VTATLPDTSFRPTLLSSCARAATAAEARFRINAAPQTPRTTCVVALDPGASPLVRELIGRPWQRARFLINGASGASDAGNSAGLGRSAAENDPDDIMLATGEGAAVRLRDELTETDFMLMIATANDGAAAATAIGHECARRGIMTAGVVLGDGFAAGDAVAALRPHARVLLITKDRDDVAEIMSAVGA